MDNLKVAVQFAAEDLLRPDSEFVPFAKQQFVKAFNHILAVRQVALAKEAIQPVENRIILADR